MSETKSETKAVPATLGDQILGNETEEGAKTEHGVVVTETTTTTDDDE